MGKYFCNPLNIEYKYQFCKERGKNTVSREAADPSIVLFKDKYYLFLSMTAGFLTSDDMVNWKFHKFNQEMPIYDYAPDVRVIGDYLYFSASKRNVNCSFYRSKDPIQGVFEEIEGTFPFWDPNLFEDEDGRIYFYWGCSNITPIYGVELDKDTLKPLSEPLPLISENQRKIGYERNGEDHNPTKSPEQIEASVQAMIKNMPNMNEEQKAMLYKVMGNDPYVEGAWMTKYKDNYYLQYSVPGTQYNVYADGVYVSRNPLGPFTLAMNNPFSYKPGGFMNGAGHGSTLEDKQGNWWHAATMSISVNRDFERRVGLWQAGFDEEGQLYCDQRYGDWPVDIEQKPWSLPKWMLLSYKKGVITSSGEGAHYITDENCRTWWRADKEDITPWAIIDLGKIYYVNAVQINYADDRILDGKCLDWMNSDIELKGEGGELRYIDENTHYTRWILEGSLDGINYFVIEDKSMVETDLAHDLIVREDGISAKFLKVTVFEVPYNQFTCISGIRVFGKESGNSPKSIEEFILEEISDLDMVVTWEKDNAVGHNILWGYAPDKLYHSYMVLGKDSQKIGALIKGEPLYIRVDSFNESGITEGKTCLIR